MRVLLIDDGRTVRRVARTMLEQAGHKVEEAAGGEKGLLAFRARCPDAVLCGLRMPEGDGLDVLRAVRREAPGVRFVAMSGGFDGGLLYLLFEAFRLGASAVLHRPFHQADMLRAMGAAATKQAA